MSISQIKGNTVDVHLWTPVNEVESVALDQLRNTASIPWVFHHVAAMADVHYGNGATVGSVIAMKDAVCPAAVGVDIGCGMGAMMTNLTASQLPDSLKALRLAIEEQIPVGFNSHTSVPKIPLGIDNKRKKLFNSFNLLHPGVQERRDRALVQCGTLGGGNHFIELCLDENDRVWLMLHSGSRNIGKEIAEAHIKIAKTLEHNQRLPDRNLAVFLVSTKEMNSYRQDLYWAQEYAFLNREVMFELCKSVLVKFFPDIKFEQPILCHHNYVAEEVHYDEKVFVTRKGAIRAGDGDMGIIPGSMGTRSYVVRGKGSEESFQSASHGAGRRMSRGAAKKKFTLQDLEEQTAGVECRKDAGIIDEIPGAYKDIDKVMANQADLVDVVAELRAVICIKG